MHTARTLILLSSSILALSACKTLDGLSDDVASLDLPSALTMHESSADGLTYTGNCPKIEVVPELRNYSDFTDDSSTRADNLVSSATITNVQTACNYDKNSITVDLKTTFEGVLGPQGRASSGDKPFFSYPFFVAVAEADGHVLTKEIFAASITYAPGTNRHAYNENMRFILPMETREQGRNQKILLGFQLTPDQLAHNRKLIEIENERLEKERIAASKLAPKKQLPPGQIPQDGAPEPKATVPVVTEPTPLVQQKTKK